MTTEQLTLVTTIIGWFVTVALTAIGWVVIAYFQRRLLERQLQAEKELHSLKLAADHEKEARQLITPQKIQDLQSLRSWLQEGFEFFVYKAGTTMGTRPAGEMTEKLWEWNLRYSRLIAVVSSLDFEPFSVEKSLGSMVSSYYAGIVKLIQTNGLMPNPSDLAVISGALLDANKRIDELIQLTASGQSYRD
ncbi:MAG: hypothetical protein AB1791_20585 [Chloroflexota bacterium]